MANVSEELEQESAEVGYKTITSDMNVSLTAHGISDSMMVISETYKEQEPDIIYANGVFELENGRKYKVGDVAIINNPKLANILLSKKRVRSKQIDRGEASAIMRNMGTPNNLTGANGKKHEIMRAMAEDYFKNKAVGGLYPDFGHIVQSEFEGKNILEIEEDLLKRLSLKMVLQTMGEDPENTKAINALEKILVISELRLKFEIKDMLGMGLVKDKFNFAYSPFKQKIGPEMELAIEEFYEAIGDGKVGSFFHRYMKDPKFAKNDWVETLALGSRSLQVILGGALFEAFSVESEIKDALDEMPQGIRDRSVALVNHIVTKQGVPVKYITRTNRSNKPLMSDDGEEIKDSKNNPLKIKKGTRIVYNMDWVFNQTKNQTFIYGAGAQKCVAMYMVPLSVLAAFNVARSIALTKQISVMPGDQYAVEYEKHAPLQVVKRGFRAGSNRE